jgi:hypothetical protein
LDDASVRIATAMRDAVTRLARQHRALGNEHDLRFAGRLGELTKSLDQFIAEPESEPRPIPPPGTTPAPPTGLVYLPAVADGLVLPGSAFRLLLERTVPLLTWPFTAETVANAWWEGSLRLDLEPSPPIAAALREASASLVEELDPELLAELERRLDAYLADAE